MYRSHQYFSSRGLLPYSIIQVSSKGQRTYKNCRAREACLPCPVTLSINLLLCFLFQHSWIYTPPKQNSQTYVGFRRPYLRQSQSKIWMCLKEGLCNLNQNYLKIPKFISQILIYPPSTRLGMWTAHPQCPLGCPPGSSTWPPIQPHLPSPPVAFHVSANSITISVAQSKNNDMIWLLFLLYLWANPTISGFKIYLESKSFLSSSPLLPDTRI